MRFQKQISPVIVIMAMTAFVDAAAQCKIQPSELNNFNEQLAPPPTSTITFLELEKGTSRTFDLKILRQGKPNKVLENVEVTSSPPGSAKALPDSASFYALIVPPVLSDRAVRVDKPKIQNSSTTDFSEINYYERSTLGGLGALVLISKQDIVSCALKPRIIYVLPELPTGAEDALKRRSVVLTKDSFDKFMLAVLLANSDYQLNADSLNGVLGDNFGSPLKNRRSLFYSPMEVKLPRVFLSEGFTTADAVSEDSFISVPLKEDWSRGIGQMISKPEYAALVKTRESIDLEIELRALDQRIDSGTASLEEIGSGLLKLEKFLLDITTAYELAKPVVEQERKELDTASEGAKPTDPNFMALIGQSTELSIMERNLGTLAGQISQGRSMYETWYGRQLKLPQVNNAEGFDFSAARKTLIEADGDLCALPAQEYKLNPVSINAFGKDVALSSRALITYRPIQDPLTKKSLVQPNVFLVVDVNPLSGVFKDLLAASVPATTCRNRYDTANSFSTVAMNGQIKGTANVKYEKWLCEDHIWICFKKWVPKTCTNTIKTRLFRIDNPLSFSLLASPISGEEFRLTLNSESQGTVTNSDFHLTQSPGWTSFASTAELKWDAAYFTTEAGNTQNRLLILKAQGKPLRRNTACFLRKTAQDGLSGQL